MIGTQEIISLIEVIYEIAQEVKANKKRCKRLVERLGALQLPLNRLTEEQCRSAAQTLALTLEVVKDARNLVQKFTEAKWYARVYGAATGDTKENFAAINERLQGCVQGLNLAVSVEVLFDPSEDALDTQQDMKEMQDLLQRLKFEHGRTREDLVAINTALDAVGIEIQNECLEIKELQRRGHQSLKYGQAEILRLLQALQVDKQRVHESRKPKVESTLTLRKIKSAEILEGDVIGNGGFGVVRRGTWNGIAVAIKKLPNVAVDAKTMEELRDEGWKHQQLIHPNIIAFYGACLEDADKSLIMELGPGGSLHYRIHKNPKLISALLTHGYVLDIIAGVRYLHDNGISHRDLKSPNIIIAAGGVLKLCDFGLAKIRSTVKSITSSKRSSTSIGTTAWMAPEVHNRKAKKDWQKVDVYAVGIIIFELVMRIEPWDGLDVTEIITAVLFEKERPDINDAARAEYPVLIDILQKCWDQDAYKRPSFTDGDIQRRISAELDKLGGDPRQVVDSVETLPPGPPTPARVTRPGHQSPRPPPPRQQLTSATTPAVSVNKAALDEATRLNSEGMQLYHKANFTDAEQKYRNALQIRERELGRNHPDVAESLNNLARLLTTTAKYSEAKPLFERAIDIREKSSVDNHPDLATSLHDFAELLKLQGEYEKSKPLHDQALDIRTVIFGPEHQVVAQSLCSVADLLQKMGENEKSKPLLERAITICQKTAEEKSLHAKCLDRLAWFFYLLWDLDEAKFYSEQANSIGEMAFFPNHPDLAEIVNNLGVILRDKGNFDEVKPLLQRAIEISEKTLGPNHPDVARGLNGLAGLLYLQGKYDEAKPLHERALKLREETKAEDSTIKDETVSENMKKAIEDLKDDGLLIIKHSRDGKPRSRIIGLTDDERKLTWKDPKKSLGAFIKLKDDRTVSLSQVTEVRPATALDPSTVGEKRPQGKGGTATFRKSEAGAKVAKRAFSLITASRTFDIECKDEDQVKILISTFKYLVAQAKAAPDTPVKPTPTETTPAKNTSE